MKIWREFIIALICFGSIAFGQTVDDYYHQAAQFYIGGEFNDALSS